MVRLDTTCTAGNRGSSLKGGYYRFVLQYRHTQIALFMSFSFLRPVQHVYLAYVT